MGADRGIKTYQVQLPFPSKFNPLPFALALWRLTVVAHRHRVQLIHCNEQNIYPIGSYLSRFTGIPAVVSVHFSMGPGLCKWMFTGRRCPSRIFFISKGNLAECRKGVTGIVPEDRWRLLPNGLDLDHYRPDESLGRAFRSQHKLGDGLLAGVACAFRSRKQLEHLFLVAKRLPANVRIVVAGGPVPDEADYAASLIGDAQRELGNRFIHVGYLTDLRGLCNALDIFVNTSQEEACCISVLEAMACGCPVVGYPSKSVDGQVLPGGGAIVAQDDTEALADELVKWCSDAQLRTAGSHGARQRVEDEFDIRKLSLAVWDEYRDLIGRRTSSLVAASL